MKRKISWTIIIVLIIGSTLFIGHYYYGLFTPYNYFTAKQDIDNGEIKIMMYGELRLNEELEAEIAKKYGFKYGGIGCAVTQPLIHGIQEYNQVVDSYLDKANEKNWRDKFQKERQDNNLDW